MIREKQYNQYDIDIIIISYIRIRDSMQQKRCKVIKIVSTRLQTTSSA